MARNSKTLTLALAVLSGCASAGTTSDTGAPAATFDGGGVGPVGADEAGKDEPIGADEAGKDEPIGPDEAGKDDNACAPIASANAHESPFFALLRTTHATQNVLSAAELWASSEAVVRGCIVAAKEGRTIDYAEGASNPLGTVVFEVNALSVLKDAQGFIQNGVAYVEFVRGGVLVDSYSEALSSAPEVVLFLREANTWDVNTYQFINPDAGHPPNTPLLKPTTSEAFVVATPEGLEHPWSDDPHSQTFEIPARQLTDLEAFLLATYE